MFLLGQRYLKKQNRANSITIYYSRRVLHSSSLSPKKRGKKEKKKEKKSIELYRGAILHIKNTDTGTKFLPKCGEFEESQS